MAANVRIPTAPAPLLTVREIRHWDEVERLRPEWIRLLNANRALHLFATPEWLGPWWQAYSRNKELRTLVLRDEMAGVVAILPMYVENIRQMLPITIRRLRLLGDGSNDSDDLDVLVQPGYEEAVVDCFLSWSRTSDWDICELNCVSPRSTTIKPLRERLVEAGWKNRVTERPMSVVPLPATWEEYLKQLSGKERGKIGNRYRNLLNHYKVNFYRCERVEEIPAALETLFRLHQKRWEAKGLPGAFREAERRTFYYSMAAALLAKEQLELWVLELNDEAVAAQIGMRFEDKVYALQEGFDPACGADSVGYVLRSQVLRYCIEHGVRQYDFLAGDQDSKQRWGTVVDSYTNLRFARPGSRGELHLRFADQARVIKGWLRAHVPDSVYARAQQWKVARHLLGVE